MNGYPIVKGHPAGLQREKPSLAEVAKNSADMDRTQAECIRQVILGQRTLVSVLRRQSDQLQALSQFKETVGNPHRRVPATDIYEVLDNHCGVT